MTDTKTLPEGKMIKADFVTALLFLALGLYMVLEGLEMPGAGGFIELGGEPGRVPVMIGGSITLLALIMLMRSASQGGWQFWQLGAFEDRDRIGLIRSLLTAAGCTFYALGLIGASVAGWDVPYYHATVSFMFIFIVGFEWQDVATRSARLRLIVMALLQAFLITSAVVYLFEQKFYVVLP